MASLHQIRANRENARKSTGPRTPEGKQRSKMNGCKHGLTAETIVMTNEDKGDFDSLRETLITEYEAVGELELQCVDRIARHYFRMLRSARVEPAMFESRMFEIFYEQVGGPQNVTREMASDPTFDIDRGIAACYTRFGKDVDLHRRYEVTIERQYYSALDQLERLQDKRARREARDTAIRHRHNFDERTAAATTAAAASLSAELEMCRTKSPDMCRTNSPVNLMADPAHMCEPPSAPVHNSAGEQAAPEHLDRSDSIATDQSHASKSDAPANLPAAPATEARSAALQNSSATFAKSASEKSDGNKPVATTPPANRNGVIREPSVAGRAAQQLAKPLVIQSQANEAEPVNPNGFAS